MRHKIAFLTLLLGLIASSSMAQVEPTSVTTDKSGLTSASQLESAQGSVEAMIASRNETVSLVSSDIESSGDFSKEFSDWYNTYTITKTGPNLSIIHKSTQWTGSTRTYSINTDYPFYVSTSVDLNSDGIVERQSTFDQRYAPGDWLDGMLGMLASANAAKTASFDDPDVSKAVSDISAILNLKSATKTVLPDYQTIEVSEYGDLVRTKKLLTNGKYAIYTFNKVTKALTTTVFPSGSTASQTTNTFVTSQKQLSPIYQLLDKSIQYQTNLIKRATLQQIRSELKSIVF